MKGCCFAGGYFHVSLERNLLHCENKVAQTVGSVYLAAELEVESSGLIVFCYAVWLIRFGEGNVEDVPFVKNAHRLAQDIIGDLAVVVLAELETDSCKLGFAWSGGLR